MPNYHHPYRRGHGYYRRDGFSSFSYPFIGGFLGGLLGNVFYPQQYYYPPRYPFYPVYPPYYQPYRYY